MSATITFNDQVMERSEGHAPTLDYYSKKRKCGFYGRPAYNWRQNDDGSIEAVASTCHSWTCPSCGPRKQAILEAAIVRAVNERDLCQRMSLTIPYDPRATPQDHAKRLKDGWRHLCDAYRKKYGRSMSYVWVKEIQGGPPHLYVFTRDIEPKWARRIWHKNTGGKQVRIDKFAPSDAPRMAAYATKSVFKNAVEYGTTCGRWCGSSRDITLGLGYHSDGQGEWHHVNQPLDIKAFPADEVEILKTDRVARPIAIRIKSRTSDTSLKGSSRAESPPPPPLGAERSEAASEASVPNTRSGWRGESRTAQRESV